MITITSENILLAYIASHSNYDAIVVEGYDGVGKGRVLSLISELLGVTPYRPDYNLWQKYDHRNIDRWKVSGFFWDIYSHFSKTCFTNNLMPMLFDRGVISGAVYNNDYEIAKDYSHMIQDLRVLHILVVCNEEDYNKFCEVRGVEDSDWDKYTLYTSRFIECLELSNAEYIEYENHFTEELSERLSNTCEGCGHYNYGWCRHPQKNCKVDKFEERCELSKDKEVQDVTEVCSL